MRIDVLPHACSGCGSQRLATLEVAGTLHGACSDCGRLQEVETRARPRRQLCDNCAFRPGSPESADPEKAAFLRHCVEDGVPFHCHKGLPMELADGKARFLIDSEAEEDRAAMKPCAGWLAYRRAHLAAEVPA